MISRREVPWNEIPCPFYQFEIQGCSISGLTCPQSYASNLPLLEFNKKKLLFECPGEVHSISLDDGLLIHKEVTRLSTILSSYENCDDVCLTCNLRYLNLLPVHIRVST